MTVPLNQTSIGNRSGTVRIYHNFQGMLPVKNRGMFVSFIIELNTSIAKSLGLPRSLFQVFISAGISAKVKTKCDI